MATSNNTSWELTRDQIIAAAYRKLGALAEGQTLSTEQTTVGVQALNSVVQLLATDGMPLWKRLTYTPTLVAGTKVYTIPTVLKITQVVLEQSGGNQYDLIEKSLYDFNRLPTGSTGLPVHYTFQPAISGGTLTIWPTPDASAVAQYEVNVVYQKEFDGFFSSTDTPDFPPYWTQAIIYFTAVTLAPETGLPLQDRQLLMKEAAEYKAMANGYGDEDGSLYLAPDYWGLR